MRGGLQEICLRRRIAVLLGVALALAIVVPACGSSREEQVPVQSLRWSVLRVDGPRVVTVKGSVPHCEGYPHPEVMNVTKRYHRGRIDIRVLVSVPAADVRNDDDLCAGSGFFVTRAIRLRRDLGDNVLYDAGQNPPVQRWPE